VRPASGNSTWSLGSKWSLSPTLTQHIPLRRHSARRGEFRFLSFKHPVKKGYRQPIVLRHRRSGNWNGAKLCFRLGVICPSWSLHMESTLRRCWLSPNRPTSEQKFRSRSSTCVYTRAVRFFHVEVLVCECC
jgi:hypothetical protein